MRYEMKYEDIPKEVRTMVCDVCHELCIPIAESEMPKGLEDLSICWKCNNQGQLAQRIALVVVNARREGFEEVSWEKISKGDRIRYVVLNRLDGPRLSAPVEVVNPNTRLCRTADNLGFFAVNESVVFLEPIRN